MCAYLRRNASAVIHTHSKVALMVTLLWPGKEFRITHLEMIKGIYISSYKRYFLQNHFHIAMSECIHLVKYISL